MKDSKIDVPVLIIFFNRPGTLEKVFDCVRRDRPSKLLLWQDGPRKNHPEDIDNIEKCREIVSNIDWTCEVIKNYHENNYGCDPSTYNSHKWAFSIVDKCVVLEDDWVFSESFLPFCKELLDKYEFDERVNQIGGSNILNIYEECPFDYCFAFNGSAGWASWRRVINGWNDSYAFISDEYVLNNLKRKYGSTYFNMCYKAALKHSKTGKAFWESIMGFDCMMNNRYAIIPKKNMVSLIGLTDDSTHSSAEIDFMTKDSKKLFFNKVHNLDGEIKHPPYIVPDYGFIDRVHKIKGIGHPFLNLYRMFYYYMNCLIHGRCDILFKAFHRRINRIKSTNK